MTYLFRLATISDLPIIMQIIADAKIRMAKHNSGQWQDGTPSLDTIKNDILNNSYYVAIHIDNIVGGCAVLTFEEGYEHLLEGKWSVIGPYLVIHRFAVAASYLGQGVGTFMLDNIGLIAKQKEVKSIRIDTHVKNREMISLLNKFGFNHVGRTLIEKTKERIVFEKILLP